MSHTKASPNGQQHNGNFHTPQNPTLYPLTDAGNGERFASMHHQSAKYCPEWKKWLIWDGTRWRKDIKNEVYLKAVQTVRSITDDLKQVYDPDARKAVMKWAMQSENGQRIREMLSQAEKQATIAVLTSDLDSDPWLFNLLNGTLNLRTGELQDHNPNDLITKVAGCQYDKHAKCHTWNVFLDQAFPRSADVPAYLQRCVGYSMTGIITEQQINFMLGKGSNGKSVFVNTISALFGEYGHTISPDTLLVKKHEKMATDIADLFKKRFVDCAETNMGRRFDESMIKQLTSTEKMTGERKYENPFTFEQTHHIFFSTNHAPEIRGTDKGIWRRIQQIRWEQTFWDDDKGETGPAHLKANKNLADELKAELSGILNWAIQGCLQWQENGLKAPGAVKEATAQYQADQDVLGGFLADCCEITPKNFTGPYERGKHYCEPAKALYSAYSKWCEEAGEFRLKQRAFNDALKERGFTGNRGGHENAMGFFGIRVSTPNP